MKENDSKKKEVVATPFGDYKLCAGCGRERHPSCFWHNVVRDKGRSVPFEGVCGACDKAAKRLLAEKKYDSQQSTFRAQFRLMEDSEFAN